MKMGMFSNLNAMTLLASRARELILNLRFLYITYSGENTFGSA
jgi:hypothetical protein